MNIPYDDNIHMLRYVFIIFVFLFAGVVGFCIYGIFKDDKYFWYYLGGLIGSLILMAVFIFLTKWGFKLKVEEFGSVAKVKNVSSSDIYKYVTDKIIKIYLETKPSLNYDALFIDIKYKEGLLDLDFYKFYDYVVKNVKPLKDNTKDDVLLRILSIIEAQVNTEKIVAIPILSNFNYPSIIKKERKTDNVYIILKDVITTRGTIIILESILSHFSSELYNEYRIDLNKNILVSLSKLTEVLSYYIQIYLFLILLGYSKNKKAVKEDTTILSEEMRKTEEYSISEQIFTKMESKLNLLNIIDNDIFIKILLLYVLEVEKVSYDNTSSNYQLLDAIYNHVQSKGNRDIYGYLENNIFPFLILIRD